MADRQPTHPPAPPGGPRAIAALAGLAATIIVILTAAAMWLSYEHLHDVAAAHGLRHSAVRAWAWPATVDLFIAGGELLILRACLAKRVDWWAMSLTTVGSLGSIALNVAGVGPNAQPLDYVVAAVPPIASLLAFGALMNQLYRLISRYVDQPVSAPRSAADAPAAVHVDQEQAVAPPPPAAPPAHRPAVRATFRAPELLPPDESPRGDGETAAPERPRFNDPRHEAIRQLYENGYRPGTKAMCDAVEQATGARPPESTVRTMRQIIEAVESQLAKLPPAPLPLRRAG